MGISPFLFETPSPDDIVLIRSGALKRDGVDELLIRKPIVKKKDAPPKKQKQSAPSSSSPSSSSPLQSSIDTKTNSDELHVGGRYKPGASLGVQSSSPSLSPSPSPTPSKSPSPGPYSSSSRRAVKKQRSAAKTKELVEQYQSDSSKVKPNVNLVVVGHVDAGF